MKDVKHNHQTLLPDDPTKDISANKWNDNHYVDIDLYELNEDEDHRTMTDLEKAVIGSHIADEAIHVGVDEFSPKATVDGHIDDDDIHVGVDEFSPKVVVDNHIADTDVHVGVDEFSPKATVDGHIANDAVHVGVDEFSPKATVDGHIANDAVHVGVDEFSPKATVDGHINNSDIHVGDDEFVLSQSLLLLSSSRIVYKDAPDYYRGYLVNNSTRNVYFFNSILENFYSLQEAYLIVSNEVSAQNQWVSYRGYAGNIGEEYDHHDTGELQIECAFPQSRSYFKQSIASQLSFLSPGDNLLSQVFYNVWYENTNLLAIGIEILYLSII